MHRLALGTLLALLILAAPASAAGVPTGCDPIDPSACLLPFPNDYFTRADPTTVTGLRLNLPLTGMPRNIAGKPIDPTDWNRSDGFSPGSLIVVKVPGMDNARAFAQTGPVPLTDEAQYKRGNAPVVVIDADSGKRWPIWTELDYSIGKGADTDKDRMLLIRPGRNFREGHRYIVALRGMKNAAGQTLQPNAVFKGYRDGTLSDTRAPRFNRIFRSLRNAGIERSSLYLAWDFTVASAHSLAGRMLHIRDDAFRVLGDKNLADGRVQGRAPNFTLTRVEDLSCGARKGTPLEQDLLAVDLECPSAEDGPIAYDVKGTMKVPCYLDGPGCLPAHTEFALNPLSGMPMRVPANIMKVDFRCRIPKVALAHPGEARPSLYGHGLFGGYGEIGQGQLKNMMAEHNFVYCATAWAGMATIDVPNVATILTDLSNFPTLADRVQQGMLNFLYLGRLMIHPKGLTAQAPFRVNGKPILDTRELFYDGNSQGGIIGGALTAVAPDFKRATLGVLGMNYSTLLTRSTDFGQGNPPTNGELEYAWPLYQSYPQHNERQLIFSLMQILWDRAEPDGYAQHMTDNPYPNTPAHTVLLMAGYGDHQVSNYAAEVEARTIGARVLRRDMLPPGRYWGKTPWYGLDPVDFSQPSGTSVFTVWDGGSRPSPLDNTAQPKASPDDDPHEWVRNTVAARAMKSAFLAHDSKIVDTCGGPCLTDTRAGG
jgi:hypothetical protein